MLPIDIEIRLLGCILLEPPKPGAVLFYAIFYGLFEERRAVLFYLLFDSRYLSYFI